MIHLKKLTSRKGTTLVETLATVLLIGIMGVALTFGIGAVQSSYSKVVRRANEQVLLSTTLTEMRNLIRSAKAAEVAKDGKLYFLSTDGYWFRFDKGTESQKGIFLEYAEKDFKKDEIKAISGLQKVRLLPTEKNSKYNLYSSFDYISWASGTDDVIQIVGLYVGCIDDSAEKFELDCKTNGSTYYISCKNLVKGDGA